MFHLLYRAVISVLRSPVRRVVFAIVLSVLIHAAILWFPPIHLPHSKVQLPPLTVRFEALPNPVPQAVPPAQPEHSNSNLDDSPVTHSPLRPMPASKQTEASTAALPFPQHVKLSFAIYTGTDIFSAGELLHQLDIRRDRYSLKSTRQTSGLASLMKKSQLIQTSTGKITPQGLQPDAYKEETISDAAKQSLQTTLDQTKQILRFSDGSETVLPSAVQDILSFMYQFSQLPRDGEIIPLAIIDTQSLETMDIEVGMNEEITTPMGKLQTVHLRKMHTQNQAYFEIWLGLEYRLLPVKFRQVNSADETIEEFVISDIRVSD